jgi:thioredoxin reductase (NADPH)
MAKKYDVIIVGGGPAGLTAGIYAGRAGKSVALFEKELIGGQITYTSEIANFPAAPGIGGAEYAMKLQAQATDFGAEIIMDEVLSAEKQEDGSFRVTASEETYECTALILATGLHHRKMNVPGEEALMGRGVSFCAVCDGGFFRGRDVAVYGGGNTAVEDAIYLSALCRKVTIIHRRDRFRAEASLVRELQNKENVAFAMEKTVSAVRGEKLVQGVVLKDVKTGEESTLDAEALFVAIGQIPNGDAFQNLVAIDDSGYYQVDEECGSKMPGIFVAGDGRKKSVRQLTTAVGDGAVAATHACQYVDQMSGNEFI